MSAGVGWVIQFRGRNYDIGNKVVNAISPTQAEALAILKGLRKGRRLNLYSVILFTDCRKLIQCLLSKGPGPPELTHTTVQEELKLDTIRGSEMEIINMVKNAGRDEQVIN